MYYLLYEEEIGLEARDLHHVRQQHNTSIRLHMPPLRNLEDFFDVGALGLFGWSILGSTLTSWRSLCRGVGRALVNLGHDGGTGALQVLQTVLVLFLVCQRVAVQPAQSLVTFATRGVFVSLAQFVSSFVQSLFDLEHVAFELVAGRHTSSLLLVLSLVHLCLGKHAVDFLARQTAFVVADGDLLAATRALDTVSVHVEGDLDFGDAARSRSEASQVEGAEQVVVLRHGSLALKHLYGDSWLVVCVGGECLRLLAWNTCVTFDDFGHHASRSLDAERERCHVHQQHVLDLTAFVTAQDGCLHCSTVGHGLVRVDGEVQRLAVEEVLQELLDLGDASRASN
ncbi:hypothetical protein B566_EDAN006959 [Ephemera danica]|nr:hypothetical protein B566_EDAN006959 [Ephemera danica]